MDCRNFEEMSQLYIDEESDSARVAQFEAHLIACEGCKREMEFLQATIQGIESYPQLESRSDLADNVMTQIEGMTSRWDFTHELEYITGAFSQLSNGQLTKYRNAFAAMIIGLILLPPRIYFRVPGIVFQRIHSVLMPLLVRWIHRARTQINHSIMDGLNRNT